MEKGIRQLEKAQESRAVTHGVPFPRGIEEHTAFFAPQAHLLEAGFKQDIVNRRQGMARYGYGKVPVSNLIGGVSELRRFFRKDAKHFFVGRLDNNVPVFIRVEDLPVLDGGARREPEGDLDSPSP